MLAAIYFAIELPVPYYRRIEPSSRYAGSSWYRRRINASDAFAPWRCGRVAREIGSVEGEYPGKIISGSMNAPRRHIARIVRIQAAHDVSHGQMPPLLINIGRIRQEREDVLKVRDFGVSLLRCTP